MADGVKGSLRRLTEVPADILEGKAPFQRGVRIILVYDLVKREVEVQYEIETFSVSNPAPGPFEGVLEPVFALPYVFDSRVKGSVENSGIEPLPEKDIDAILVELEAHIERNVFASQRSRQAEGVAEDRVATARPGSAFNPIRLESGNPAAGL